VQVRVVAETVAVAAVEVAEAGSVT
jgi:hypothetical protein